MVRPTDTIALAKTLAAEALERSPSGATLTAKQHDAVPVPVCRAGFDVELGATIGSGGMGLVREGVQRSLGRSVAVKTVREDRRHEAGPAAELLREAWITGALEHPNIVPVHDLAIDDAGTPMILLKRIGGIVWSELVRDPPRLAKHTSSDPLEWHLRTLMQVCNAIELAHRRGILHRDLKPANVMIGEVGEVYVLDWGIAVSLEDDGTGRFPLAADAREAVGTPAYMAPEMLGKGPLSCRTDIYLLGATLFEILAGRPPHGTGELWEVFARILDDDPELPASSPPELAAICKRAMSRDPADRFEDVESFRRAVASFLDHRASIELARQADRRLAQLSEHLERAPRGVDQTVLLYNLFGACRFGFRHALASWPENPRALHGLRLAVESMIGYELAQGNARAAGLLLAELDPPPAELALRVRDAEVEQQRRRGEQARLRELGRDLDPRIGRRRRVGVGLALGVVWALGPITLGFVEEAFPWLRTQWTVIGGSAGVALLALGLWRLGHRTFERTAFNRRLAGAVFVALGLQSVMFAAQWMGGLDHRWSEAMLPLVWASVVALVSLVVERRLWPAALAQLAAFMLASLHLELRHYAAGAAMAFTTVNLLVIWRSRKRDDASGDEDVRPTLAPEPPD